MNQPRPPTLTYSSSHRIWLAPLLCPHCQTWLGAEDVELFGDHVRLICTGCHHDMLVIERLTPQPALTTHPTN